MRDELPFVDEATLEVEAGRGGDGAVAFHREAQVARGGPSGGDGGRGGDVVVVADERVRTLAERRRRWRVRAEAGAPGGPKKRAGPRGADVEVGLPPGTVVEDATSGERIADLATPGQRTVVARGGCGGRGNARFATSTRQAPRIAESGQRGEKRRVGLDLRLLADVGLVGLPNAGKTTFLRAASRSRARVGDYPFTTLQPNLGVAKLGDPGLEQELVVADLPGLVEGAAEGRGLGDRFLKHVARTRVLLHLLSLAPHAPDPVDAHRTVRAELAGYAPELLERPSVTVLTQIDLLDDRYEIELWVEALREAGVGEEIRAVSALTGERVREVLGRAGELLERSRHEADEVRVAAPDGSAR